MKPLSPNANNEIMFSFLVPLDNYILVLSRYNFNKQLFTVLRLTYNQTLFFSIITFATLLKTLPVEFPLFHF